MLKLTGIICLIIPSFMYAQSSTEKQKILYGKTITDSLKPEPFGKWFNTGYTDYHPNADIAGKLRKQNFSSLRIEVFFGTWCGDSRREVPRFLKLANEIGFPVNNLSLIAVGGGDSLVKQSPQHEEAGKGIFRVPTMIIYKDGKELGRINEFPVNSLEKDLLAILESQSYTPNYHTFSCILRWMKDGTLNDENIGPASLAEQLRPLVRSEFELNSLAYLLLKQGMKREALRIFQANYSLYPESANIISSLGEGYYENGDYKRSVNMLERSLEFVKKPAEIKPILEILYKAKEKEKS